jgi:hypothetical protein
MDQIENRDRQYEETVDPKNPPNSVLRPQARRATVTTFVGGIVVFFLIVGAALIYWNASNRRIDPDPGLRDNSDTRQVGTAGQPTPGGGSADPAPGSTRDELQFRGGEDPAGTRLELHAILDGSPADTIGRRVNLHDVDVATVEGGSFWIHDGNARVQVLPPSGAAMVRNGQVVDVSGVVESNGGAGIRIRADRVAVN